jgi:hypothetical protein
MTWRMQCKKLKMTILVHKERLNVGDESQSVNLLMFPPHSAPHDDSKPCPTYIPTMYQIISHALYPHCNPIPVI